MKTCKMCWQLKDDSLFYKNKRVEWWLSFYCKKCLNEKNVERRRKHKEKWNEYKRKYDENYYNRQPQPIQQPQQTQQQTQYIPKVKSFEEFEENFNKETLEALCQSVYKEAYEEIMSDADYKRAFEEKRDEAKKLEELEKRQDKINKEKERQIYAERRAKMRSLADQTLDEKEKKELEDSLMDFWDDILEKYIWALSRLTLMSFKVSRHNIYEVFLDKKLNPDAVISI